MAVKKGCCRCAAALAESAPHQRLECLQGTIQTDAYEVSSTSGTSASACFRTAPVCSKLNCFCFTANLPSLVLNSARAGITHDVKEYPEAGHSFLKCQDTLLFKVLQVIHIAYNERAAEDARGRIVRFFQQHLGG